MPESYTIELRCSKTSDGKYDARTFVNGKELKKNGFTINRGDDFAVVQLYLRMKKQYPGTEPIVKGLDKRGMEKIIQSAGK